MSLLLGFCSQIHLTKLARSKNDVNWIYLMLKGLEWGTNVVNDLTDTVPFYDQQKHHRLRTSENNLGVDERRCLRKPVFSPVNGCPATVISQSVLRSC